MEQSHFEEVLQYYQDTKYNPRRETLRTRVEAAYPILEEKARNRQLTAYSDLAEQINADERRYLSVVLGSITRMEDMAGRPPLSAVAVKKNQQMPNDAFFELLDQLEYGVTAGTRSEIFQRIRDDLADEWGTN